ncbi:MAG: VWA domain-containing protein, partial [Isosphaeraceae bacterium]|nr:VWA domain-containing protein [Isosphaeraceae bacterium]
MFHLTFSPIAPWPLVALVALAVGGLTLWAYRKQLQGARGRGRWIALGLRVAAVVLCLMAAVRPTVVLLQKVKQTAALVFLVDATSSMNLNDEVGNRTRWDAAKKTWTEGLAALKKVADLEVKSFRFDDAVKEHTPEDTRPPKSQQSALGTALAEVLKRQQGTRLVGVVLLSDGASNAGPPPLSIAQRYRSQQVPIVTVGYGSETAGASSRDIAVRSIEAGPFVFVKNELNVRGTLRVRGYQRQPIEVELWVEGKPEPVQTTRVEAAEGTEVVTIKDLKWIPQVAGEARVSLKVKPRPGEIVTSNNELSTYVEVKKGGLNALFIQGPNFSWEPRFLTRALDSSQEIQVDYKRVFEPGKLDDTDVAPGRYDVYILGDVPANFLTPLQHDLLVRAIEKGAGLVMLG